MKKILVIGGNGFIGKNIVEMLITENYDVTVYDLSKCTIPNVKSYCGNVLEDEKFGDVIKNIDVVVYLISAIMPQKSNKFICN